MPETLSFGSNGVEVKLVQATLNSILADFKIPLACDGIFGSKTLYCIKTFQSRSRLTADGVIGPMTWAKLLSDPKPVVRLAQVCRCHEASSAIPALTLQLRNLLGQQASVTSGRPVASAFGGQTNRAGLLDDIGEALFPGIGAVMPKLRAVTSAEKAKIDAVYGSSIDYSAVVLSDVTGQDNRAFVVAVPNPIPGMRTMQVVNIGTSFTDHTLVHEFGHVWQSQHHNNSTQYMVNAIVSQKLEELLNDQVGKTLFSAYAYVPGRPFQSYGAEQMAQAAANGDADVVRHVKSIPMNTVDPQLLLIVPRVENITQPGVKT